MSSALAVWDVTRTIHVEQIRSLTQCLYYCFRKQSVQNRGEKFNHKRYRIILEIKECRWRAIFPVIYNSLKPTTCTEKPAVHPAFTLQWAQPLVTCLTEMFYSITQKDPWRPGYKPRRASSLARFFARLFDLRLEKERKRLLRRLVHKLCVRQKHASGAFSFGSAY